MNNVDRDTCGSCIYDILRKILLLQKQDYDNECYVGCDKPYLGPICNSVCYNTRPIQLYNCSTANPWTFSYTTDGVVNQTNIFRVEALDDCCCTCRLLYQDPETLELRSTNEFCTINLECCGAIRCLNDTYVDLC